MRQWQVQEAKARFSEFLDEALKKGPQIITRRGVETAVMVPIQEWKRLQRSARPGLKELLLTQAARHESLIPERSRMRRRPSVDFE